MSETEAKLHDLHDALAQELLDRIKSGEATTGDLGVAAKMLKDNHIECVPSSDNNLGKLMEYAPVFDDEAPATMN